MVVAGENSFGGAGLVSLGDPYGVSERGQLCKVGSAFTTFTIVMRGPLQGDPGMAALHSQSEKGPVSIFQQDTGWVLSHHECGMSKAGTWLGS